jgi:hypothetical protein
MLSGLSLLEIKDLQKVIENFHLIQIANFCGHDYLFDSEKDIVEDILGRGSFFIPYIEQYYKLGVLRTTNPLQNIDSVDWRIMENFLSQESKVIKLTTKEKGILSSIKTKNYSHIKGLSNSAINDLNNVISQQESDYRIREERILREELSRGVASRKTVQEITKSLFERSGRWDTNFELIVRTELASAESAGAVAGIKREFGEDSYVYVHVNDGACSKCVKMYLTNGSGSRPKVFLLKDLESNGSNVGRKTADYLPVVPPAHPNCYCSIRHFKDKSVWSEEEKKFNPPKNYERKVRRRGKVKIVIGDRNFEV